jgi:DNA-binding NarL/FixJ family response regulator
MREETPLTHEETPLTHEETINVFEYRKAEGFIRRKAWSNEEINRLIELHGQDVRWAEIAKHLERTEHAVEAKAQRLGLRYRKKSRPSQSDGWTDEEVRILKREWHKGSTSEQIAKMLGRTPGGVRSKRIRYNLPKRLIRYELKPEIQEKYDDGYSICQLSKEYNIDVETLRKQLIRANYRIKGLTEREREIIEDRHHDGCTDQCIARRIRRHSTTVNRYIRENDLSEELQSLDNVVYELKKHGLTMDQIGAKLELPRQTILYVFKRNRRKSRE